MFFILPDKSILFLFCHMRPEERTFPVLWLYSAGHATSSNQRGILTAQESTEDMLQTLKLVELNRKNRNQILFWHFPSHNSP